MTNRKKSAGSRGLPRTQLTRHILSMTLAAAVSLTAVSNSQAQQYLFRYSGDGPVKLGEVVVPTPGPTNPTAPTNPTTPTTPTNPTTPARKQLTLTAPSNVEIRSFEGVPAGTKAVSQDNVATVIYSISPTLPQGLKLGADGSITGQALAAAPLTTYTLTATDGVGGPLGTATATFDLKVDPRVPLAVAGVSTFAFEQGEAGMAVRLTPAADVTIYGNPVWTATTAVPAWMIMTREGNDLVLSGTPSIVNTTGVDVGFTLADDHGVSAAHVVKVTVTPPVGASVALPDTVKADATFLAPYYSDIASRTTYTKAVASDFTFALANTQADDAMVPGLKLASDGTISGSPLSEGTFRFGVKATGPSNVSDTKRYTIKVSAEVSSRVAATDNSSCVMSAAGSVKCWGLGTYGRLGNGLTSNSSTPVAASVLSGKIIDIAGGYGGHVCALKEGGTVSCWGLGNTGQLGQGAFSNSVTAVEVSGLTDVRSVVAGYSHSCALKNNGSMWCWGEANGLGNNSSAASNVPVQVSGMGSGVISMAAGNGYSCASKSDGSVWCWGSAADGRLGNNSTTNTKLPVRVSNLSNVTAMTGGFDHTCATSSDRTVSCWGSAQFGQLGNGSTVDVLVPVKVTGLTDVYQLSTGDHHNCAIKTDRTLWCWGKNATGQLGDGTKATKSVPVQVANIDDVSSVTAVGFSHTCASKMDGSVWCWGDNGSGKLGDGTTTARVLPVRVNGT